MRTITNLFILTSSLLLASCSQSDDALTSGSGEDGQVPISVEASIANATLTRTAGYTPVPDGGAIGIFRTAPVTTDSPAQYDVKYTYGGSPAKWSPDDADNQITVGGEDATLCAYYPQGTVTFTTNSTVTSLTVKDYSVANDLCYADKPVQANVNNSQRKVSFLMNHAYARIQLHIKRYANPPAAVFPCKVSSIRLEPETTGSEFYTERTIDIGKAEGDAAQLGGTKTTGWTLDTSLLPMGTSGIAPNTEDTSIDKLFPPQIFTANTGTKVTLNIDGIVQQVIIPYGKLQKLAAGNIYQVKLELHGQSLKLLSVEIMDWQDVTVGTGDDYETH